LAQLLFTPLYRLNHAYSYNKIKNIYKTLIKIVLIKRYKKEYIKKE